MGKSQHFVQFYGGGNGLIKKELTDGRARARSVGTKSIIGERMGVFLGILSR